jgi:hypothetical protein
MARHLSQNVINLCILDTQITCCCCVSCVMVVGLTSSLQVKWCSDNCSFEAGNKMQIARCQSQTVWRMVQIFKTKLQVCCTVGVRGWVLSCRTAPLLRLEHFLLTASFKNFSVTQYVTISYTLMFQDVR